jgi:hypothetical protein
MKILFTIILFAILLSAILTVFGQWPKYTIDSYLYSATIVDVADIDGDGDLDMVATAYKADIVVWYENGGDNLTWTEWTIDANLDGAAFIHAAYINDDTYSDAVVTGQNANKVLWYKNPGQTSIK